MALLEARHVNEPGQERFLIEDFRKARWSYRCMQVLSIVHHFYYARVAAISSAV